MPLRGPSFSGNADRDLECEMALAPEFQKIVAEAIAAGWTEDEVANALLSMSQDHVHAMRAGAVVGTTDDESIRSRRRAH